VESCYVSASLSWATSLLQDWSRSPEVGHLFMTFGLLFRIELADPKKQIRILTMLT
jgi:hypothetical protein